MAASKPGGLSLSYWEKSPPLAAAAAADLAGLPLEIVADPKHTKDSVPILSITKRESLKGTKYILSYLARTGTKEQLYGDTTIDAVQIDQWLDFAPSLVSGSGLEGACTVLNEYLALRTFLVGYRLSIADVYCWAQLQATLQWDKLRRSGSLPHLARWFGFVSEMPQLKAAAERFAPKRRTRAAPEPAKDGSTPASKGPGAYDTSEVKLPGAAEGKVVTRFPPEPSGYLHIGHAKAALLNQYFADLYKGEMILRFDDTNPSKEKDDFVENIISDVKALGLRYGRLTHTSDYFPQLLDMAERLIKAGLMYADDTPVEQMREERMDGIPSKHRDRSPEESLAIWKEMVAGSPVGLENCMRFKIDMSAPNKALRDPVAYRCNLTPHIRTGTQYKVYPTYDCACPFVDSYEGVTHALRTSEYKDREEQFQWVLRSMQSVWPGLPPVHVYEYSRLSFVNTLLSKRKLTWFVDTGRVQGWDDPRMPTVQGLLRRGMTLEAMREFILSQGASKNITFQEWDKIWTINKRIIDPVCPRHTAVEEAGRVLLRLTNGPEQPEVATVLRHKKHPPAGVKATTKTREIWLEQADAQAVAEGEEVTLMDWGNAIIRSKSVDGSGAVTGLEGELHLEGSVKGTRLKLTWLPQLGELVPLSLVELGHLITKGKLEDTDAFEDFVNPSTWSETPALGDANMRTLQRGDILQLERKGYFIVDAPLLRAGRPLVLLSIPDGRSNSKSMGGAGPAANGKKA